MADVGRPPLFESPEELEAKINEYFDFCDNRTKEMHSDKLGDMIVPDPEPYTMSGLAYALGMDRRSLLNYSNKEAFFPTVKKARDRVEKDVEKRLIEKGHAGIIFNLKNNFDWKDERKTDVTTGGEPFNFSNLNDEQLNQLIQSKLRKAGIVEVAEREAAEDITGTAELSPTAQETN